MILLIKFLIRLFWRRHWWYIFFLIISFSVIRPSLVIFYVLDVLLFYAVLYYIYVAEILFEMAQWQDKFGKTKLNISLHIILFIYVVIWNKDLFI